jgi:hypothetical protein
MTNRGASDNDQLPKCEKCKKNNATTRVYYSDSHFILSGKPLCKDCFNELPDLVRKQIAAQSR